jgi:hypothetical protein
MKKTKLQNWTDWQKSYIEARTPKMPEGLTDGAQSLFQSAVSKITYAPTENGGISRSIERLSTEEAFAIGETGTASWGLGIPASVRESVVAASPRIKIFGGKLEIITPMDEAVKHRLLDVARKSVLVTQRGEKFIIGSKQPRTDELQKMILDWVRKNPNLRKSELIKLLKAEEKMGIIVDINEEEITFGIEGKLLKNAPLTGLKDRLSRASKTIEKENKSR